MALNKSRKLILIILFILAFVFPAYSQNGYKPLSDYEIHTLIPSTTRYIASLYGKWEASYDDANIFSLTVPYSNPDTRTITYTRTIRIDNKLLQRFAWQLYFLGLDDQVDVYFNNQFVGRYLGGMTPFTVRIPSRIITNETNTVKLVVSPAMHAARQIKEINVFTKKIQTGIPREIFLIGTPNVWISQIEYKTKFNQQLNNCLISAKINISSAEVDKINKFLKNDTTTIKVPDKANLYVEPILKRKSTNEVIYQGTPQKFDIDNERTITLDFAISMNNPILWSTSNPELYELGFKIIKGGQLIDDFSTQLGFRDISVMTYKNMPGIYLNDSLLEIKGVDYIEDYINGGQTISSERMEKDIQLIKTLGANLICVKYSIPHPYFVNLCDKYGILLLVELPVYNVPNSLLELDEIKVRIRNLADRLLSALSTHPSIIAWGISEGVQENVPETLDFSKSLLTLFRHSSGNLIYRTLTEDTKTISPEGFDFLVFRTNRKPKTYDNIYSVLSRIKQLDSNNKPIVINYGIPIQPMNHSGYSDPMSIESQSFFISNYYRIIKQFGFSGSLLWSFNDYELNNPLLILNGDDLFTCTSGLVGRQREERLSFLTLQTLFNNEKEPLLNAGSYSERTPIFFIIIGFLIIGALIFLVRRYRRFREYIYRSLLRPFNFFADVRDQRIISSTQTLLLGFFIAASVSLYITSILYFYKTSEIAQFFGMLFIPSEFLQELFYRTVWMPELLSLILTVLFFALIFIASLIIKLFSLFVRGRIYFMDSYTITIWAGTPFLLLLPLSIILIRLLHTTPLFVWL
ncbi:MAG: glycoside hydrolase family 2 TIM barrel-domain containing protein, partial [FCB group bacterium]